jgi:hypothetical protein
MFLSWAFAVLFSTFIMSNSSCFDSSVHFVLLFDVEAVSCHRGQKLYLQIHNVTEI